MALKTIDLILTGVWAPIVCVDTAELAGRMLLFEGRIRGLEVGCFGWIFSLEVLGLAICWTFPCVAIVAKIITC